MVSPLAAHIKQVKSSTYEGSVWRYLMKVEETNRRSETLRQSNACIEHQDQVAGLSSPCCPTYTPPPSLGSARLMRWSTFHHGVWHIIPRPSAKNLRDRVGRICRYLAQANSRQCSRRSLTLYPAEWVALDENHGAKLFPLLSVARDVEDVTKAFVNLEGPCVFDRYNIIGAP